MYPKIGSMSLFESILVGLALGPEGTVTRASRRAALQARWLAEQAGSKVTLLHTSWDDHFSNPATGGALLGNAMPPEVLAALESVREEFEGVGVPCDLELDTDRPWLAMTRRAAQGRHDLVVVARRNELTDLELRTGTNSRNLLRNCPVPVWVVAESEDLLHRSILVATDLSEVGSRATRLAARLAVALDCELHIVHALEVPFEYRMLGGEAASHKLRDVMEALEAEVCTEIASGLERELDTSSPRIHVEHGPPARVIRDAVERIDPDLLVMGTVSRTGVPGLVIGNTAERLVDDVDCSLVTVKPLDFECPVADV